MAFTSLCPLQEGQRRRNDNINKICVLEGVGEGKFYGKLSKTLFFLGNSMTIKLGNFTNFIVRNFVVIWEAPRRGQGIVKMGGILKHLH